MEARRALNASAISRNLVMVVVALLVALGVVMTGILTVRTLPVPSGPSAGEPLAGQLTASGFGSAWNYGVRHSGTQTVEGPAPIAVSTSSTFHEPGSRRGGSRLP